MNPTWEVRGDINWQHAASFPLEEPNNFENQKKKIENSGLDHYGRCEAIDHSVIVFMVVKQASDVSVLNDIGWFPQRDTEL